MVLMEVLRNGKGSVGYGGSFIPPGRTFECRPKDVAELVEKDLARPVEGALPEGVYEVEGLREKADGPPVGFEPARVEERQALFDELVNLGITAAAKTNTKTLRNLVERARMEAKQ